MNIASLIRFLGTNVEHTMSGGLGDAMDTVIRIADILLACIYVVLGLFLVIKGAILGVQIVKAADEPQVRQEKIGALKWLVIGCAIAFGITFAADVLTGVMADEFK